MRANYDISVIIGRFQPIHKGHMPLFERAEQISDYTVCVIGSVDKPATPLNPFSFEERKHLIQKALKEEGMDIINLMIGGVRDSFYCDQDWIRNVRKLVAPAIESVKFEKHAKYSSEIEDLVDEINHRIGSNISWETYEGLHGKNNDTVKIMREVKRLRNEMNTVHVCVLGYEKDESSYYLHSFSDWDFINVGSYDTKNPHDNPIDASAVRELWLTGKLSFARSNLHLSTYGFLSTYDENAYLDLKEDYDYIKKYGEETQVGPFPVQFLTTDAVVVHGDEILLIRRGAAPGKGLWALPGGFKDKNERFFDSCIRELREETRISVPEKVLRGSVKEERMFDFPKRSSRGTTVSMAYLFVLDPTQPRPRVKGGDDAVQAWWFNLSEIDQMRDQLFEDHPDIIDYMTARL